jgi:hypothetical protein
MIGDSRPISLRVLVNGGTAVSAKAVSSAYRHRARDQRSETRLFQRQTNGQVVVSL